MESQPQLNASSLANPSQSNIAQPQAPHERKKCGLYLAQGISFWNFLCILLISFESNQSHKVTSQFSTLLLQDKEFYDVDIHSLGRTKANYKTILAVVFLFLSFFGRFFYQVWSYRTLIPLMAFLASASVFAMPWGHSVYPGLLSIQFVLTFSLFVEGLNPMLVDYVQNRSKGMAISYNHIVGSISSLMYSFVYVYVLDWTDSLLVPIYIIGTINFLTFIYLVIFVKNIKAPPKTQAQQGPRKNCCARLAHSVAEGWIYSVKHKVFLLIFFATFMKKLIGHITSGGLVVYVSKYVYHGDVIRIAHHTKYLGISTVLEILLLPVVGHLFDKYSARFLYTIFSFLCGCSLLGIFYYDQFTSPYAFALQIAAQVFINATGVLIKASLVLHTPIHLKAGLFSISELITRLSQIADQQISGPVLDSNYAIYLFFIGGIMSMSLALIFLIVGVCCKQVYEVVEREQTPQQSSGYKELDENINYK